MAHEMLLTFDAALAAPATPTFLKKAKLLEPNTPPGIHGLVKCSSSTDKAMLASSGDKMPPCGVPVIVS